MTTKKAKLERTRVLLDRQPAGVPFSAEVVNRLNSYTGWDAIGARKVFNAAFPSDNRCVEITLPDGTYAVWSWRKAIAGYDPAKNVDQAMRSAIAPYLFAFMKQAEAACAMCGSVEDLTVDHASVPFSVIAAEFKKAWPGIDTLIVNTCTGAGWQLEGHLLENWVKHHNDRATYQVLCRSCNASKGTN